MFYIDTIVRDDDITMRAVLKHSTRGAQGQVLKSSKGKLDDKIPVPSLLSDTPHCMKVVDEHIFSILNDGKAHQCGFTKNRWSHTQ